MPRQDNGFRIEGGEQLTRLAAQLKASGERELLKELRAGLRKATAPVAESAKKAVLEVPVKGTQSTGLRALIASSIVIRTINSPKSSTVLVRVDGSKMGRKIGLDKALESSKGWRHPVYGNTKNWVHQDGHPWFYITINRYEPAVHAELQAVMDRVLAKLL